MNLSILTENKGSCGIPFGRVQFQRSLKLLLRFGCIANVEVRHSHKTMSDDAARIVGLAARQRMKETRQRGGVFIAAAAHCVRELTEKERKYQGRRLRLLAQRKTSL